MTLPGNITSLISTAKGNVNEDAVLDIWMTAEKLCKTWLKILHLN